jgi:hypothetical protein
VGVVEVGFLEMEDLDTNILARRLEEASPF